MLFDIQTIVVVLGLMQALQMLVFYFQYKTNKSIDGPGWWFMWSAFETLGFIFIFLRTVPSLLPVIIVFQDVVLFLGTVFIYIGVLRFFNKRPNLKFIFPVIGVFLALHLFFIFAIDSILARSVAFAVAVAIISFGTAISLIKNKTKAVILTANLNAAIFILHGLVFSYRGIMILAGTPVNDMFSPTFFNFLPYADAIIVCLPTTISFIIMLNQRLNSEITETKSHFEHIFNSSPDASVISSLEDGLIIETNDSFAKMTNYQKEEIIGKTIIDLEFWKNPSERTELVKELKAKGYCENREFQFKRKGGEIFTGLFSAKIITLKGLPHLLSVTHDISERTRADEILRLKNEELRQSNMEKDKLFSIIAHDLRNPITGFMGLTDLLAEELPNMTADDIDRLVAQMRKSSANLYSLLENLLDWSKVEQGLLRLNPQESLLQSLVDENLPKITDSATRKKIRISSAVPEGLKISSDINVFHTVLRNLLSNAVKFTHKNGEILISARNTDRINIEISVKDNGIGMSHEMVSNLFKLDAQVNRKGTEGEPSTGLGLILCKGFIEAQGGRIWVESEEGKGTVFYFTLPGAV
jgi:PAS domain S-box-containing protein